MAAELDKLAGQAKKLATNFRQTDFPGIAHFLEDEARKLAETALFVRERGGPEQFGDVSLSSAVTSVPEKEKPQEYRPFTEEEKEALRRNGAVIFNLTGETIDGQREAGRLFRYVADGGDRLLKLPSIINEVAIFPDPKRFFIPNSGNKDLPTQEELAEEDGRELRERLGLKDGGLDVIIPAQASTFTELTFQYLDETTRTGKGVWLFGLDYGSLSGRTKNPVNESGSHVAHVGCVYPGRGVSVDGWHRDLGLGDVRVVRLVVAKKK